MTRSPAFHLPRFTRPLPFGMLGVALVAFSCLVVVAHSRQLFFSYLFAWLFWTGLSLGCLLVTMIHQLTGGRWGYPTRRFFEAGFMTLPLMAILFIPLMFGLKQLYPWTDPIAVVNDNVLAQRHAYQNTLGFILRTAFFFAVVIWMAFRLRRLSLAQDTTTDAAPTRAARVISGPGVVVYPLLATFIYVDWIMSLEKHWYSTMFPVIIIIGQILTAYAFAILMLFAFRNTPPFAAIVNKTHFHHLGTLLFTFVLFWTYISFGQLLIIYSGDLPDEIDWYTHRIATSWKVVVGLLAGFHFFVPFFLLLCRTLKKSASALASLAGLVFVMHIVDTYWLVMPALHQRGIVITWTDFSLIIGIGALWFGWFVWRLGSTALVPQHDPGMQFAFKYEHPAQC